jgi:hypothetical protein
MSFHRENVIWQSPNGTWSRGFYDFFYTGDDPEWDVEYDMTVFNWCSTGHATEDEAHASWNGANPGGYHFYPYKGETNSIAKELDLMAKLYREERQAERPQIVSYQDLRW